jgi:hypothetical protein
VAIDLATAFGELCVANDVLGGRMSHGITDYLYGQFSTFMEGGVWLRTTKGEFSQVAVQATWLTQRICGHVGRFGGSSILVS